MKKTLIGNNFPQLRQHRKLWACCCVFDWQASLHTISKWKPAMNQPTENRPTFNICNSSSRTRTPEFLPVFTTVFTVFSTVPAKIVFAMAKTQPCIAGSAVALHCCKAHAKVNRKMGNSIPSKVVAPENIILKLCMHDYVGEMTHHANFGFNRWSGGIFPNRRNFITLWLFWLSCPGLSCHVLTFFLDPAPSSNRRTDFHALWLKRCDSAQGWSFSGLERWVTIFGGNMPPKHPPNRRE